MVIEATINERSPFYMTIAFKDELGAPYTPTTVDWRLDDQEANAEIVPWTSIPSPKATMCMMIPGANNSIVDKTKVKGARTFGVRVNDGLTGEAHQEFQYCIVNQSERKGEHYV